MALPHPEIFGFLSHDQLAQNYQAYRHDFERLVVAERVLATMPRDAAHGNDYGLIRRQQLEAANSVLLHEFYFRNLAVKPMKPSGYVLDNLNEHMGSSRAGARTLSSARESRHLGNPASPIPTTIDGTICRRARRTQADGWEAIRWWYATSPRMRTCSTMPSARNTSRGSSSISIGTWWRRVTEPSIGIEPTRQPWPALRRRYFSTM